MAYGLGLQPHSGTKSLSTLEGVRFWEQQQQVSETRIKGSRYPNPQPPQCRSKLLGASPSDTRLPKTSFLSGFSISMASGGVRAWPSEGVGAGADFFEIRDTIHMGHMGCTQIGETRLRLNSQQPWAVCG